jgi:two-component system chemotaxis response regulator CheY
MPQMSGVELIEKIRSHQEFNTLPVMVISTEGREDFLSKTQKLGVAGYLKKPFQATELRNAILAILEENNADIQPAATNDDEDGDF